MIYLKTVGLRKNMADNLTKKQPAEIHDIRLIIPIFLLNKLKKHPLTQGLYPLSLGKSSQDLTFNMKQSQPAHHCLIYCQSGSGILDYKNKKREVSAGDLVILTPNQDFTYQVNNNKAHAVFWINFQGTLALDFAQRLLMKMDDGLAHVSVLSNILSDFNHLLALGRRGYTATNVIHAVHILQQALSFLALQLRLSAFNNSSAFDIDAVERLMRDNLHQELSLDTLAHYSKLSKFHFSKKFKELTDTSPIQHFINMKIQRACFDLDKTQHTIKQIGEGLGYNDPYYFSRLFKKSVGMSPKQYRDSGHK
jgi:AraC-like DNA-binding protein